MKIQAIAVLTATAAIFSMTACEQQQWSSVKQLFSHGNDHGHGHGHGDAHGHGHEDKKDSHQQGEHGSEDAKLQSPPQGQAEKKDEKH